jgi:hypothetical protein
MNPLPRSQKGRRDPISHLEDAASIEPHAAAGRASRCRTRHSVHDRKQAVARRQYAAQAGEAGKLYHFGHVRGVTSRDGSTVGPRGAPRRPSPTGHVPRERRDRQPALATFRRIETHGLPAQPITDTPGGSAPRAQASSLAALSHPDPVIPPARPTENCSISVLVFLTSTSTANGTL